MPNNQNKQNNEHDEDNVNVQAGHHNLHASIITFNGEKNESPRDQSWSEMEFVEGKTEQKWHDDNKNDEDDTIQNDEIFRRFFHPRDNDLDDEWSHEHQYHRKRGHIKNEFIWKNMGEYISKLMGWAVSLKVIRVEVVNNYIDELVDTSYLQTLFAKLDKDGDKYLTREELYESFVEIAGDELTENEIEIIINFVDENNDGQIEFEEFIHVFQSMKIQSMEDLVQKSHLYVLFHSIDKTGDDRIEYSDLKQFFEEQNIPLSDDELIRLIDDVDNNNDGRIDFYEFEAIFSKIRSFDELVTKARLRVIFNSIDTDGSGTLEFDEIKRLFIKEKVNITDDSLMNMMSQIDANNDGLIDFEEFETAFDKISNINELIYQWQNLNSIDLGLDLSVGSGLSKNRVLPIIAGGCGGIASRTMTAPLTRVQLLSQTGVINLSILKTWIQIIEKQGFLRGLWKGNLLACLRVFPFAGCVTFTYSNFLTYVVPKKYRKRISNPTDPITHFYRFLAGCTAGSVATTITYPMDTIRTREAIDIKETKYGKAGQMIRKQRKLTKMEKFHEFVSNLRNNLKTNTIKNKIRNELRENNITSFRSLYTGLSPTLFAMSIFVGVQNTSYDFFRLYATSPNYLNLTPKIELFVLCGCMAGITAQSVIHPMDVIRRRIQTETLWKEPPPPSILGNKQIKKWIFVIRGVIKEQGIKPMFAGLVPTYLKVAPSVAISVTVRDIILGRLNE